MSKRIETVLWAVPLSLALVFQGCTGRSTETKEASVSSEVAPEQGSEAPKGAPALKNVDGSFKPFYVYSDAASPDNHYDPSGWMGDTGDLSMTQEFLTDPHGGTTCIRVGYSAKKTQGAGWAGVYWQNPSNNWGSKAGGYDLSGAQKLTFWARGEKGGERIEEIKIGGITGEYPDSDVAGIGPLLLTTEWKQYSIDLKGKDLTSISGGFCWVASAAALTEPVTFFLDDIVYE